MPTLSTDSARHTLALRLIRACLRLESGRLMDFLPDLAEALQFALASTVTRSSSKQQEYWQAAKGMAISAIFVIPKQELSYAFRTQSSAHRICSQGTTQSSCRALQELDATLSGAPNTNLSDAAWTQSSAYRFSSQGTTQRNCGAPADSRGSCLGSGRYDAKPGRLGVIVKAKVCDSQIVKATTVAFNQRTETDLLLIMKSRTCAGGQAQNGLVSIWR